MPGLLSGKMSDLLKIAGIVIALSGPCLVFYTVTKTEIVSLKVEQEDMKRRLAAVEQFQADKIERIFTKLDQTNKDVADIKNSVVRLQTLIDRH